MSASSGHSGTTSADITNEAFLEGIFKDQWEHALVAGFAGDPQAASEANWTAFPARMLPSVTAQQRLNLYFCPSLVRGTRRVLGEFVSFHVIVVDDYGTKVVPGVPEKILGRRPNYVLETSLGNYQAGWIVEPITDLAWLRGALKQLKDAIGDGDNLADPMIWRRLPVGVNGKPQHRNWQLNLATREFQKDLVVSKLWLKGRMGPVVPLASPSGTTTIPAQDKIDADPVLQAFHLLGRVQGQARQTTMGWGHDVECPWVEEHSVRAPTGAVYVPVHGRFHCHHGHCQDRDMGEVRERLDQLLREHSGGTTILATLEFDAVDLGQPRTTPTQWQNSLQRAGKNGDGPPIANSFNVMVALKQAPEFTDAFGFNAFTLREMLRRELPEVVPGTTPGVPRPWRDQDTALLQIWLQGQGLRTVTSAMVDAAVNTLMHEHAYHPVRDWLQGLTWDGTSRLDTWLSRYLGTAQDPYHANIGRWFLMTMCRRIHEPGCRADYMLVLEGPQGQEKSSLLARLAGPKDWFSDNLPDIGTKEASEHLVGRWLVEIAEMDRFDRAESAAMKAFVSRTTEQYRRAYARRTGSEPRQCVFAGTVNHRSYLKDETGNRRYWPVAVGRIDLAGLTKARDQLFAEAWHRAVMMGEQYWPDPTFEELFIQPEQDERLEPDPWDHLVMGFLQHRKQVLVHEVIAACTGGGSAQLSTFNRNRVMRIMETLRWKRGRRGPNGERFWYAP